MEEDMWADLSPSLGSSVKQVEDKLAASEIKFLEWSPKMDLVAAATLQNDVVLYRLQNLKKAWSYPAPFEEGCAVVSITWEPNGRTLAIAYSSCQINVIAVEKAVLQHTHHVMSQPVCVLWTSHLPASYIDTKTQLFTEKCDNFLPKMPPLEKKNEQIPDMKRARKEDELDYLIVSCENGLVSIYVFGLWTLAQICISDLVMHEGPVFSTCLSQTGAMLSFVTGNANSVNVVYCASTILEERCREIRAIADKFVKVFNLLEYCEQIVKQMEEAWEDSLLEMDSKLTKFAELKSQLGEGTVLNDFLELLLFGTPSDDLKTFLLNDLTEKGMKKLGMSMQNYYRTIQSLILTNLQSAVEAIMYHLDDLQGMSRWTDKFAKIGLCTTNVTAAIQATGSFALKVTEMLHVITTNTTNLKAFAKWLFLVILRLSEPTVPSELEKYPVDHKAVAEYLQDNFKGLEEGNTRIRLEKVGQYLKDCDLHFPVKSTAKTIWTAAMKSPLLRESELIFKEEPTKSMVQLLKVMMQKIDAALVHSSVVVTQSLHSGQSHVLSESSMLVKTRQFAFSSEEDGDYIYSVCQVGNADSFRLLVARASTVAEQRQFQKAYIVFQKIGANSNVYSCSSHSIVDFDHYDKRIISVLLRQTESPNNFLTAQVDLTHIPDSAWTANREVTPYDIGPSIELESVKILENLSMAKQLNVSGNRKIGSVLISKRRVRLYMYEVDPEDSDNEENTTMDESADLDDSARGGGSDKENTI